MMRNVFKLILFSLVLNLATGIMTVAVVDADGNQVFGTSDMSRIAPYNPDGVSSMTGTYICDGSGANRSCHYSEEDQTIKPGGTADTSGNIVFRLLDLIGLGFINKILNIIDNYLFGFINLLDNMFGQFMNGPLYDMLFPTYYFPGILKSMIMVGYLLAAFELWTNKTLVD
jgi:hypothetical protein